MLLERSVWLDRLLDLYAAYFDIERDAPPAGFDAFAAFHTRSEKYVLVKSAQLWAIEANEYIFFASVDRLDLSRWQMLHDAALAEGLALIKPHREHMYSYISLIILADEIDPAAARQLKRCHFHKSFLFSFHGWSDLRVAAVECPTGQQYTNRQGKALLETLERVCK